MSLNVSTNLFGMIVLLIDWSVHALIIFSSLDWSVLIIEWISWYVISSLVCHFLPLYSWKRFPISSVQISMHFFHYHSFDSCWKQDFSVLVDGPIKVCNSYCIRELGGVIPPHVFPKHGHMLVLYHPPLYMWRTAGLILDTCSRHIKTWNEMWNFFLVRKLFLVMPKLRNIQC